MKVSPLVIHPHHMDFFENLHNELLDRGHKVLCLVRYDELNKKYLQGSNIKYSFYGSNQESCLPDLISKYRNQFSLVRKLIAFRPDLVFSVNSVPYSPFNSIFNIYSVAFLDRKLQKNDEKKIFSYADKIVTPDCYPFDVPSEKQLSHPSYHPFAYLHPNGFKSDPTVLDSLEVKSKDYVFVSFARRSWEGFTDDDLLPRREKIDIVRNLSEYRKVLVDGRGSVPKPLKEYVPALPLNRYNHVLANAELVVGDDPIICAEAGVLGIPWIFISQSSAPTLEEQEIQYEIGSQVESIEEADELAEMLLTGEVEPDFDRARKEILNDKIDLTEWMIRFVEIFEKTVK